MEGGQRRGSRSPPEGRGRARTRAEDMVVDADVKPPEGGAGDAPEPGPNRAGGGVTPRGGGGRTVSAEEQRQRDEALTSDYVVTIPKNFNKTGSMQHKSLPPPEILTNYFKFNTHPKFQMRLYSVKVEPPTEEIRVVRSLVASNRERLGAYLLNGFNLYSTVPIANENLVFPAVLRRRDQPEQNFVVHLEFVRDVEPSEPTVFQFYNVLVRQMLRVLQFTLLGRHFFDHRKASGYPAFRLELWPGFLNSIRQQDGGLMINVESTWKLVQTTPVLDIMTRIRQEHPNNYQKMCEEEIVGMMVLTRYNPKAYKISRIDFQSSPQSTFAGRNGPTTYLEYYQTRYNVQIRVPVQPMLVCDPRERDIRRGQAEPIYLVPELCFPCGLTEAIRSNFQLMRACARDLHMEPERRVNTTKEFINRAVTSAESRALMIGWGVRVETELVRAKGRFLNTEEILMNNDKAIPDDKADWTTAFRSKRMLTSMQLSKWAMVSTGRDSNNLNNLIGTMQRVAGPLGYQIQRPQTFAAPNPGGIPTAIRNAITAANGQLDLVFVVLPSNNLEGYGEVKRLCSTDYGIPSQCFLSKNLTAKGLMSICTKMVIQMNAKQGGVPWGVSNPLPKVMVLGYDVHHAGPGGGKSIGAMCATMDHTLGRYYSCVRPMPSERTEVAPIIAAMFQRCLDAYKEKNACYPAQCLMYRDGVGEGQLRDVFQLEIQAFKERIATCYGVANRSPAKLIYVVVNKRITTRLIERTQRGMQNPRPGLVVDNTVTRPERYDFFLVSQTARQGCVSPTYYNVLYDEMCLPADRLQMYTWKMCHLYYNWSGTVAVPAACQNAHKLALQVGTAIKRPPNERLRYLLHFL